MTRIKTVTRLFLYALSVLIAISAPAKAAESDVLLSISGALGSGGNDVKLSRADLEKFPMIKIKTITPWTKAPSVFEGISLNALLTSVNAHGETLTAKALNDYAASLPISDLAKYDPILAMKMDGKVLRVRDKGPLWIIYPWDSYPETQNEIFYGRSVWQIKELIVK